MMKGTRRWKAWIGKKRKRRSRCSERDRILLCCKQTIKLDREQVIYYCEDVLCGTSSSLTRCLFNLSRYKAWNVTTTIIGTCSHCALTLLT